MDCEKIGRLIYKLRQEKNMTQKQLADVLNVSDKAVSKWERGAGFPDISLLRGLSDVFEVNVEKILSGELNINDINGGNMKKIEFYACPKCGSILNGTGNAEIQCCGKKLLPLEKKNIDENHTFKIEPIDDEYYITFDHEMTKEHYISFVACVKYDRALIIKLYPEQNPEIAIPKMRGANIYFYCTNHCLFYAGHI